MRSPAELRDSRSGFSLVELLVIIAITGIVLASSYGSLRRGLSGHELQAATTKVVAELRLARQKAVTENNNYTVTFDPSSDGYIIWDDDGSDGFRSQGEAIRVILLPEELRFGTINIGNSNIVTFRANGSADKGGYLEILGATSGRRQVTIVRSTGAVTEKSVEG